MAAFRSNGEEASASLLPNAVALDEQVQHADECMCAKRSPQKGKPLQTQVVNDVHQSAAAADRCFMSSRAPAAFGCVY